jgi:hypothetical protein
MAVNVRFVGSGDSFGSGGRFQTCILVDGPQSRFAIDFGTSSLIDAMLGAKRADRSLSQARVIYNDAWASFEKLYSPART